MKAQCVGLGNVSLSTARVMTPSVTTGIRRHWEEAQQSPILTEKISLKPLMLTTQAQCENTLNLDNNIISWLLTLRTNDRAEPRENGCRG